MQSDSGKAALYLRSSKDRTDISPATQRHALELLAASRSLSITQIYEDAVESGSTENRPAFSELLRDIKKPHRGWTSLLVYDTSRLARRRYIAQALKHECKKRGITILYATRPADVDPISEIVLDSVLEAMDEVHSLMSRQKGLAGMAENVRQGWRAGGRAPLGYQLKMFPTGAIREGRPVTKSKLTPAENAHLVSAYLKARAGGMPRIEARRRFVLDVHEATLIHLEWNALTYAGHTVWNVHREVGSGARRRPRAEWHIHKSTHDPLITEREAESLIAQLETSNIGDAIRRARACRSNFLLSGILCTTDGRIWLGHGSHYRLRRAGQLAGRIVPAHKVDQAVIEKLQTFRTSERYLEWLLDQSRQQPRAVSVGGDILGQIRKLEREQSRAAEAAVSAEVGDIYSQIVEQRTRQIAALRRELDAIEREAAIGGDIRSMGVAELRALVAEQDPTRVVRTLVDRVVLEPSLDCQIQLRRQASYNEPWRPMASPALAEGQPQGLILRVALR